jgi:hypothetical protein
MKRGMERVAVQGAWLVFVCVTLLAIGMVALLVARPPVPAQVPEVKPPTAKPATPTRDPLLEQLASAQMTKKVEAPKADTAKRTVMPLNSMIRLKGTMDFGDPKSNEAIIENIRTNETKSYRVGQMVEGPNAKVLKIDQAVTFTYEGQEVRLEVPRDPETGAGPLTGPGRTVETAKQE